MWVVLGVSTCSGNLYHIESTNASRKFYRATKESCPYWPHLQMETYSWWQRRPVLIVISKMRPILIPVSIRRPSCSVMFKEKTEEEEDLSFNLVVVLLENLEVSMILTDKDQPLFVEGLYSRKSLSQPGENDANIGAHLQAEFKGPFLCDDNDDGFYKSPLNSCFGHLWTCFKA